MNDPVERALHDIASRVLDLIHGNVPGLTSTPDRAVRHFAAAGLLRCCLLLRGVVALESVGLSNVATGLARQHWETSLVSLDVLLEGEKALIELAGDDITGSVSSQEISNWATTTILTGQQGK